MTLLVLLSQHSTQRFFLKIRWSNKYEGLWLAIGGCEEGDIASTAVNMIASAKTGDLLVQQYSYGEDCTNNAQKACSIEPFYSKLLPDPCTGDYA